jgi:hypothetical protein
MVSSKYERYSEVAWYVRSSTRPEELTREAMIDVGFNVRAKGPCR